MLVMNTKTAIAALAGLSITCGTALAGIQLAESAPIADVLALGGITFGFATTALGYVAGHAAGSAATDEAS